jgi:hypothetical protein
MGDAIRNYHKELLDGVLESFRNCSPHICGVYLPIGPKGRIRVDSVTCVLFIIQDMQEGDMCVVGMGFTPAESNARIDAVM